MQIAHAVPPPNVLDQAGEEALYRALRRFWHPVMWADELRDSPAPATLLGEQIALVRLGGEVVCFKDLCVHRGTALSLGWVDGDHLVCAYHGWTYNSDGVCTRIPATHGRTIPNKARVQRYRAAEQAGLIWVCLADDEPLMPIPPFPEIDDPSYRTIKIPTYDWHASAARRIENFVDFSHFAWVHAGVLGDPSRPEIPDHDVVRDETSLRFSMALEEVQTPVKADSAAGAKVEREPTDYVLWMPFTVYLNQPLPEGKHFVLYMASCPVGPRETRSFTWNARNYQLDPSHDQAFVDFQQLILEQDRRVVESQRPEQLPIDLSEELHIKGVDAVSILYRRWLGEIAATARG